MVKRLPIDYSNIRYIPTSLLPFLTCTHSSASSHRESRCGLLIGRMYLLRVVGPGGRGLEYLYRIDTTQLVLFKCTPIITNSETAV